MSGQRWTREAHGAVRQVLNEWVLGPDDLDCGVEEILAALADAGLLVTPSTPDGPRTCEWASNCAVSGCQLDAPACHLDATGEVHSGQ